MCTELDFVSRKRRQADLCTLLLFCNHRKISKRGKDERDVGNKNH